MRLMEQLPGHGPIGAGRRQIPQGSISLTARHVCFGVSLVQLDGGGEIGHRRFRMAAISFGQTAPVVSGWISRRLGDDLGEVSAGGVKQTEVITSASSDLLGDHRTGR